jgi:uncharacterized protein (AIM24 family)
MHHTIKSGNAYGCLRVELKDGEFLYGQQKNICAFSDHIVFSIHKQPGFLRRLAGKFLGEHLGMDRISAIGGEGWVMLAPPMVGAITGIDLHNKNIMVEQNAFLAASSDILTNGRIYQLAKNKFAHDNFQAIKFGGDGLVFLNSFGAVEIVTLLPEQAMRIHPDHLIAWDEQLVFDGLDRGFITVSGPGRLWLQTRSAQIFHDWQDNLKKAQKSAIS